MNYETINSWSFLGGGGQAQIDEEQDEDIEEVKEDVEDNLALIQQNQVEIAGNDADILANTTAININITNISNLDTRLTTAEGDILDLDSRVDDIEAEYVTKSTQQIIPGEKLITFPPSDPLNIATKGYVDTNIASAVGGITDRILDETYGGPNNLVIDASAVDNGNLSLTLGGVAIQSVKKDNIGTPYTSYHSMIFKTAQSGQQLTWTKWDDQGTKFMHINSEETADTLGVLYDNWKYTGRTDLPSNIVPRSLLDSEIAAAAGVLDHNDLQNKQGGTAGEFYHLSNTLYTNVQTLSNTISNALHFHDSDRARANHTGTQNASSISDFDATVSLNGDVTANTTARHTHANQTLLDSLIDSGPGFSPLFDDGTYRQLEESDILALVDGGPYTVTTLQQTLGIGRDWGLIRNGEVISVGDGTIDVNGGAAFLRDINATDGSGTMRYIEWSNNTGIALSDNTTSYVYAAYNGGGAAQILVESGLDLGDSRKVLLASLYRRGNEVEIGRHLNLSAASPATTLQQNPGLDYYKVFGITLTNTGLTFQGTFGIIKAGSAFINISAYDSSTDLFSYWYRDGVGGWTEVASQTAINPGFYDNGSGTLATIPAGKWKIDYIFRSLDINGIVSCDVVYSATIHDTIAEVGFFLTAVPPKVSGLDFLAGVAVTQQGSASTSLHYSAYGANTKLIPSLTGLVGVDVGAGRTNLLTAAELADLHTHTNLPLLETLIDSGPGTNFLADDGTYKVPAGGGGGGATLSLDLPAAEDINISGGAAVVRWDSGAPGIRSVFDSSIVFDSATADDYTLSSHSIAQGSLSAIWFDPTSRKVLMFERYGDVHFGTVSAAPNYNITTMTQVYTNFFGTGTGGGKSWLIKCPTGNFRWASQDANSTSYLSQEFTVNWSSNSLTINPSSNTITETGYSTYWVYNGGQYLYGFTTGPTSNDVYFGTLRKYDVSNQTATEVATLAINENTIATTLAIADYNPAGASNTILGIITDDEEVYGLVCFTAITTPTNFLFKIFAWIDLTTLTFLPNGFSSTRTSQPVTVGGGSGHQNSIFSALRHFPGENRICLLDYFRFTGTPEGHASIMQNYRTDLSSFDGDQTRTDSTTANYILGNENFGHPGYLGGTKIFELTFTGNTNLVQYIEADFDSTTLSTIAYVPTTFLTQSLSWHTSVQMTPRQILSEGVNVFIRILATSQLKVGAAVYTAAGTQFFPEDAIGVITSNVLSAATATVYLNGSVIPGTFGNTPKYIDPGNGGLTSTPTDFVIGESVDDNLQLRLGPRSGSLIPRLDATYDIGSLDFRWDTIYAQTGTIQTSAAGSKVNIVEMDGPSASEFIKLLTPSFYQFNKPFKGPGRIHSGIIAEDVKVAVNQVWGTNMAVYAECQHGFSKGVRWDELAAISLSSQKETLTRLSGDFLPLADSTYSLGSMSLRWDQIFARTGVIQISDSRRKRELTKIPNKAADSVIKRISTYTYRFVKEDGSEGRRHAGILAEDLKAAVEDIFGDLGAFSVAPDSSLSVRWDEITALLLGSHKFLQQKVKVLTDEVAELKSIVQKLMKLHGVNSEFNPETRLPRNRRPPSSTSSSPTNPNFQRGQTPRINFEPISPSNLHPPT